MRKLNMCAFSLMTAGLMAVAVVSPAAAADKKPIDVSKTARMISVASPSGPRAQQTSYSGLAATNVSVGPETTGVPCGECVPGAGGNNKVVAPRHRHLLFDLIVLGAAAGAGVALWYHLSESPSNPNQ